MAFAGFSEADIKKVKTSDNDQTSELSEQAAKPAVSRKGSLRNNTKPVDKSRKILNNHHSILNNLTSASAELPDGARLSPRSPLASPTVKKKDSVPTVIKDKNSNIVPESDNVEVKKPEPNKDEPDTKDSSIIEFKGDTVLPQRRTINLDEFESRQKLIEEQNRKRKELLAKALADRTRQTQEEAQRLNEIQSEFKKLDALLSNDVRILRKQIEIASIEYLDAEKKYRKVEKDYLEAKLYLHQKLERKHMLTEHLCAIIERNEERKADKLTELLQKLHMSPQEFVDGMDTSEYSSPKPTTK